MGFFFFLDGVLLVQLCSVVVSWDSKGSVCRVFLHGTCRWGCSPSNNSPLNDGIYFLKSLHLSVDLYRALEREMEPPLDPSFGSFSGVWTTENYALENVVCYLWYEWELRISRCLLLLYFIPVHLLFI